ncbi:MAG: hypothetical protein QM765_35030 [Myxococcales bacterium]
MRRRVDAVVVAVLVLFVFSGTAHAYIDPGAGSLALQIALAAVFACLFAVRASWAKLRNAVGRLLHRGSPGHPSTRGHP